MASLVKHGKHEKRRVKKRNRFLTALLIIAAVLAILYTVAVYSDIPFIKKYRDLYIETAMNTFTHKWLATRFIPKSVIDKVVANAESQIEANIVDESAPPPPSGSAAIPWDPGEPTAPVQEQAGEEPDPKEAAREAFLTVFHELDADTLPEEYLDWDYETLMLSGISDMGIKTTAGDAVWAIDAVNGILIMEIAEGSYRGKLAIVKDPSKVFVGVSTSESRGWTIGEHLSKNDAVLGINANGFVDPEGEGRGESAVGLIIAGGKIMNPADDGWGYQVGGFDGEDNFLVGTRLKLSTLRDAAQFMPAIVVEGTDRVTGSYGLGIQPRTVIGQNTKKEVLMLVIDGRQVGYSIGCTVSDCAKIVMRYDCWNALCMDGGSSSCMAYYGELITKPSSPMVGGRYLPNAWLVRGQEQ